MMAKVNALCERWSRREQSKPPSAQLYSSGRSSKSISSRLFRAFSASFWVGRGVDSFTLRFRPWNVVPFKALMTAWAA
jgi:hypothetical protein